MSGITFANYGQERERIATEQELRMFDIIREISGADDLDLINRTDYYVTVVLGEWDVARIKYAPRAKWILFPLLDRPKEKRRIESPEDVRQFAGEIKECVERIRKYS